MPRYDVRCPEHGEREVERSILVDGPFACPESECGREAPQIFRPLRGIRVEDMENAGAERGDWTNALNLGLPGENIEMGRDETGKERLAYRPRIAADTPAWKVREICKEHNLTSIDGGRYRTVGQR